MFFLQTVAAMEKKKKCKIYHIFFLTDDLVSFCDAERLHRCSLPTLRAGTGNVASGSVLFANCSVRSKRLMLLRAFMCRLYANFLTRPNFSFFSNKSFFFSFSIFRTPQKPIISCVLRAPTDTVFHEKYGVDRITSTNDLVTDYIG